MQLTLTKLPWYAQVGAFVALAVVGCGLFYYYYEQPLRADIAGRQTQLEALRAERKHDVIPVSRGRVPDEKVEIEARFKP